jgi:hypothetical protein
MQSFRNYAGCLMTHEIEFLFAGRALYIYTCHDTCIYFVVFTSCVYALYTYVPAYPPAPAPAPGRERREAKRSTGA